MCKDVHDELLLKEPWEALHEFKVLQVENMRDEFEGEVLDIVLLESCEVLLDSGVLMFLFVAIECR